MLSYRLQLEQWEEKQEESRHTFTITQGDHTHQELGRKSKAGSKVCMCTLCTVPA